MYWKFKVNLYANLCVYCIGTCFIVVVTLAVVWWGGVGGLGGGRNQKNINSSSLYRSKKSLIH